MVSNESPVEWCKRMQDKAKTGEEAMAYYELMNLWKKREDKNNAV